MSRPYHTVLPGFQAALFLGLLLAVVSAVSAGAPAEQFTQLITEVQKAPGNPALREKIIALALTLDPKPVVPEEYERYKVRAATALNDPSGPNGLQEAVAEYEKAAIAAPWLAEAYYNLAVTQRKAGMYDRAAQNLKFYLLAAPDIPDARTIRNQMYELEFKGEKMTQANADKQRRLQVDKAEQRREIEAATERHRQAAAASARQAHTASGQRELRRRLEQLGWVDGSVWREAAGKANRRLEMHGTQLWYGSSAGGALNAPDFPGEIFWTCVPQDTRFAAQNQGGSFRSEVTLSADGLSITSRDTSDRNAADSGVFTFTKVK
jgi:tetratricopeptide (TPR) repeat protein